MSKIIRPFHLAFPIYDIRLTIHWYQNTLGCKIGRQDENWVDFNFFGHQLSGHLTTKSNHVIPKNIVDEVGEQLLQNLFIAKNVSEYNNSKYIFALQPTLLVSKPKTVMDKKIIQSLSNYKNINMVQIYKDYYSYIKNQISLKNNFNCENFLDLSNIFENTDFQNYIDTVHMGNRGQEIISNNIGEKILKLEENKYDN